MLLLLTVVSETFVASTDQLLKIGRHLYRDAAPDGAFSYATERKRAADKNLRYAIFEDTIEKKRYTYSISEDQLIETSATIEEFAERNFESASASIGRSFLVVRIRPAQSDIHVDVGISDCFGRHLFLRKDVSTGHEKLYSGAVKCCF